MQRKPEGRKALAKPCHISRGEFDERIEIIAYMTNAEACEALKRRNQRLLPHISKAQEKMWVELCGVWFKRRAAIAELARLRRERNSRGETVPLNRGRLEVERVAVVRG